MNHPHFDIQAGTQPSPAAERAAGAILVRTADCLTALLQGPTATAGLNESRYNVLDTLRRMPGGTSTQTDLAARLLQSESNLSTLLERMRHDELISRVRSETDRRKSLIGLTDAGREALARADLARSRATAALFKAFDDSQYAALCAALGLLLQHFEGELGVDDSRVTPGLLKKGAVPLGIIDLPQDDHSLERDSPLFQPAAGAAAMTSERQPQRTSSLVTDGLTT